VYIDRVTTTPSMSGRTEAMHRFLTLRQPIDECNFSCPRILAARKTYTLPFTFTIPPQLLPRACSHVVSNDQVRESHLMLPPSLGDPELAGFGKTLLDDLAPEMSKVIYGIKVRLTSTKPNGSASLLAEKMKKIRVKPAFQEQPPLNVDPSDIQYRMRKEKEIKKGLFRGKLGILTAQCAQPKALVIPGVRMTCNTPITTMAKVLLRFDPADETSLPPRLGSMATKIKVTTHYASAARQSIPTCPAPGSEITQAVYEEYIPLSTLCIASVNWKRYAAAENPLSGGVLRRDSDISNYSISSSDDAFNAGTLMASKGYRGGSFYIASVVVPVSLPMNKNFLPTFHSCMISRTYTLSLHLSAHAPGVSDPTLRLKIPIQIAADGSETGKENARVRNAEEGAAQDAADPFTLRSMVSPIVDELPPQYALSAPRVRAGTRLLV
jgi:hypothetical protein